MTRKYAGRIGDQNFNNFTQIWCFSINHHCFRRDLPNVPSFLWFRQVQSCSFMFGGNNFANSTPNFCNCWHLISNKRRQGVDVLMKLYTYMYQKFKIHNKAFGGPLSFCIICEEACPSQTYFG